MQLVDITIPNWEKYNPRADRVNYSWLRFQNRFFEDPLIFALSAEQKVIFIYCLCEAAKINKPDAIINTEMAAGFLGIPAKRIYEHLQVLVRIGVLAVALSRPDAGMMPAFSLATVRDETVRDGTKTNTAHSRWVCDLDLIYKKYPRKVGKQEGYRRLRKQIQSPEDEKLVLQALENYLGHLRREGTEAKYVMHFSTWTNRWRDWLDPETGNSQSFAASADPAAYVASLNLSHLQFDEEPSA